MIKTYKIFDMRKGMFAKDIIIEANNPKEAVIKAGYREISRDFSGKIGHIIVTGKRGSYVFCGRN